MTNEAFARMKIDALLAAQASAPGVHVVDADALALECLELACRLRSAIQRRVGAKDGASRQSAFREMPGR
jgi:hypothetical protein